MADNKTPEGASAALSQDEGTTIPRIKLNEQGFLGLRTINGRILDEANQAFLYPNFIKTVQEIRHNPTVGSAMQVYRMMVSRVNWRVVPHKDATPVEKERARIIGTMMHDMEGSWKGFIEEVVPYLEYGFGVHEKVFRRRLKKNGSAYQDGLVGLRKIAPRNQETIEKWIFSDNGADLLGVQQNISNVENSYRFQNVKNENGLIPIDREKFLLFTASANRGNPQGNSMYKNIYMSYKILTILQEQELIALSKDVQGILKIELPPQYLAQDASPSDKAVATAFQEIIDNYNRGEQRGLLVPMMYDDSKNPLFKYDLMEARGTAKYDLEAIIKRLQTDILSALNVDILQLGNGGTGSFSLADAKTSVLAMAIDYRLREIQAVLNDDLMKNLHSLNGWSQERMPQFVYEDVEDIDMTSMGKFIQQCFSVGAIEADRPVMNRVRSFFGVEPLPDDAEVDKDKLPPNMTGKESMSGEGLKTAGDGTRKSPMGAKDASAANANNK
jgi:hypothetical protein